MTNTDYRLLKSQLVALIGDETDALANASNFVGLLYNAIDDVNWLGVYVPRLLRFTGSTRGIYLTRDTYSRERVSTLMTSF